MRKWLGETAGGLPRSFWYLWVGNLINRAGAFVTILLAFYLSVDRGLSPSAIGLVIGLIGAGGAVGVFVGGQLTDFWGRRKSLLLAQCGTAAALLAMGYARELWQVTAVAVLIGLTQSMARPAFSTIMIDVVPPADRMRAFSLNFWANNLAFAFASIVGGAVAGLDFQFVFVVDAITTLAAALFIFVRVGETKPVAAARTERAERPRGPYTDFVFLSLCGMAFLTMLIFMQHQTALPLAMAADGMQPATYGLVLSVNAVMIVLGQLFVPKVVKGWARHNVLALAALVVGIGFGMTAWAEVAWFYAITVIVWTVGEMIHSPAIATLISDLSPEEARGRYQGAFQLSMSGALFAAPLIGGLVIEHLGETALWTGCLVLGVVLAALNLVAGPVWQRRIEPVRQDTPERAVS